MKERTFMHLRRNLVATVTFVFIFGALVTFSLGAVAAQGMGSTATPGPSGNIKQETLGKEMSAVAPDKVLLLNRRTFAPGADSGAHAAAGPVGLFVESGEGDFTVVKGAALVTTAGAKDATTLAAGKEVALKEGDVVTYDAGVVHEVYNEGNVPAITLESRLNPAS
jgi:quercetin dioxygenase-like cupin family protein